LTAVSIAGRAPASVSVDPDSNSARSVDQRFAVVLVADGGFAGQSPLTRSPVVRSYISKHQTSSAPLRARERSALSL
jgi:hypothetical protein